MGKILKCLGIMISIWNIFKLKFSEFWHFQLNFLKNFWHNQHLDFKHTSFYWIFKNYGWNEKGTMVANTTWCTLVENNLKYNIGVHVVFDLQKYIMHFAIGKVKTTVI